MLQVILILELVLGILCMITRKKGRVISAIIVAFMFLNFTAAQSTMDSFAYSRAYSFICDGVSFSGVESLNYGIDIGFYLIARLVSLFSNNYMVFRGVVFIVSMFFIMKSMKLIDRNSRIAIVLFLLFPFQYDTFQIEFFLAYALVTYGITLLICDTDKSIIKYIILVVVASLIHIYALPFMLLLLFKVNGEKLRRVLTSLVIVLTLLNIVLRVNYVSVINSIFPFINRFMSFGHYIIGDDLNILTIIMSITLFLTIYYYSYNMDKQLDGDKSTHTLFLINSVSLIFLPFIFTSLNFERYFRPLLIINYVFINKTAILSDRKARYIEYIIIAMLIFRFTLHWNYYVSNNNDILQYFFDTSVN